MDSICKYAKGRTMQAEILLNLSTFAQYEYPNNYKTACLNDLCTQHLVMNNCLIGYEGHVEP